jgi:serine/threonine protein kinase
MARVYLARETELGRLVAVKILRRERATEEEPRLRFEREARAAASLSHPNVVTVHRFGRLPDGTPYLTMSYVRGRTLADHIQANGLLGEPEARSLLAQLASALAAAHKKGIVHRDVKTSNVLVDEESGRYMLMDFGIAAMLDMPASSGRITRTGQVLGDPRTASPEQLQGKKVTEQTDVYSLAILAYEVLTGSGPYRAKSTRDAVAAHLTGEPQPITRLRWSVSPELEALLLRCLAREPMHRPRAEDLARQLAPGERTSPVGPSDQGLGILRRRIPQIVSLAFAGGMALLGLVIGLVDIGRLPPIAFDLTINLIAWGLLASGVLAWFHGERGTQRVPTSERWILAAIVAGWSAVTWILLRG